MTRGFFFFKQKTAYEMRISDWSSDVCSSDLLLFSTALFGIALVLLFVAGRPGHELGKRWLWLLMPPAVVAISAVKELSMATERKSVVSGKGVSVRLDLGGAPNIQKKKSKHIIYKKRTKK